jgi:Fibronectin type III domain
MARFPITEAKIASLARSVIGGLKTETDDFPSPPAPPDELQTALDAYTAALSAAVLAAGKAKEATAAKDDALAILVDLVKSDLRYAENHVRGNHAKLHGLGWGGRRPRKPRNVPGQVLGIQILHEGPTSIELAWKPPVDGGAATAYQVERRKRAGGAWAVVGTAVELTITLEDQEGGIEFEYRVKAINKAGRGPASSVVRAVL